MLPRILMISTSRETAPQPTVPIGAAWVAEALRLTGFQVRFLDLCFVRESLRAVEEALCTFKPIGIALSVRNLDNCDFFAPRWYLPEVKVLVDFIRSRSDAPVLLGGAGVSIMPVQVLEYLGLDYAVVGEGEKAAVGFFQAASHAEAARVPGVVCRRGGKGEGRDPGQHFSDEFVAPQIHKWVATRRYLNLEPVLPVQGKRGCVNHCLYCTYRSVEGGAWRIREAGAVVEEIECAMHHTGAREFEFVDSIFNEPEGYLETVLEEILRRGLKARFSVSSLSPKGLTRAQVQLMEKAGMTSLVITPESASNLMLSALNKGFTSEDVHRAAELLSGSSMRTLWCFLIGGPQEDEATLAQTARFLNEKLARKDGAYITTGMRIYPGTGLHELALREGVVTSNDDLLKPTFYFSDKLTPHKTRELLTKGLSQPQKCLFASETRAPALGTLRRIGTFIGLPTPFWRYAGYSKKILPGKR